MADILIKRAGTGVAIARTTDPYSSFEVHRIDRERWDATPEKPGIYVLYGTLNGAPTAYVGMSTANMRARIRSHHVNERKVWFGVLFAIPLAPGYCTSVEAELIRRATDAEVVVVANDAKESRWLGADDTHVEPALEAIGSALELLLGTDIFTARDEPGPDAGTGAPGAWTMERWLTAAREASGDAYANAVRTMVDQWMAAGAPGRRVEFGNGRIMAAIFLVTDAGPRSYWPLAIYPTKVEVPFQWMTYRPATESEGFRRDLLDRLNAIDGIDLDEAKLAAKPSFPPSVLEDPATCAQVMDVVRWFYDEVRSRGEAAL